jgi:hypothetical protein
LYLSRCQQFVSVGGQRSAAVIELEHAPQGSVLRPLLLTSYVAPIMNTTAAQNIIHTQYANDTQLYISLEGNGPVPAINDYFLTLRRWFHSNGLSLNPDKYESIIIGTAARHRSEGAIEAVTLGDVIIPNS